MRDLRRTAGVLFFVLCSALVATMRPGPLSAQEPVDLILHGGTIFTADDLLSIQHAVAIRDGRIVDVGGEGLLDRYRADRTIDLDGKFVVPGFIDSHIHISGDPRWYIDLNGVSSIAEIQRRVRAKADELEPGHWITGYGWSEDELAEGRRPLRGDLDEAAADNPVILTRAGGHSAVANSRALEVAGVDESTPQPEKGIIEKDDQGRPNGVIRERQDIVQRFVPEATWEQLRPSFVANLQALFAKGITSIVEASNSVERYQEQWVPTYREHRGELPRVSVQIRPPIGDDGSVDEAIQVLKDFGHVSGEGDEWLRVGPMKVFVDGGFTGPAAWTIEPYKGQPDYYGVRNLDEDQLYRLVKAAHDMGWQGGFHTIGDAAIRMAVDVYDRVLRESPAPDRRHYLTHFTVSPPDETMRTMARDNILIVQQPNFTYTLAGRYVDYLTADRAAHNNPVRVPMEHGIFMAFSSDILPIGPLVGIYAAVTRKGMGGRTFAPEEEATGVPQALAAYTRNGAYITHEEDFKGTVEPGTAADLAVLDRNLVTIDPEEIMDAEVLMTLLGGRIVYRAEEAPASR